jgi:hypothetical protein
MPSMQTSAVSSLSARVLGSAYVPEPGRQQVGFSDLTEDVAVDRLVQRCAALVAVDALNDHAPQRRDARVRIAAPDITV